MKPESSKAERTIVEFSREVVVPLDEFWPRISRDDGSLSKQGAEILWEGRVGEGIRNEEDLNRWSSKYDLGNPGVL